MPALFLAVSTVLLLLPLRTQVAVSSFLELTLFVPYRYAVGWGPGSLAAQAEMRRVAEGAARERWREDRVSERVQENRRLRRLVGFRRRSPGTMVPASIVARQRGRLGEKMIAELSRSYDVPSGIPVLVPEGLLGWTVAQHGRQVEIECLAHPNAGLSILNQRSRQEAILRWSLERRDRLVLLDVPIQSDWRVGDRVVTSGLGTIFPRGLLVGRVLGERREPSGPLKRVFVEPAASAARAEELFLLLGDSRASEELYPIDADELLSGLRVDDFRGLTSGPVPTP